MPSALLRPDVVQLLRDQLRRVKYAKPPATGVTAATSVCATSGPIFHALAVHQNVVSVVDIHQTNRSPGFDG